jgi:hypothetical protein
MDDNCNPPCDPCHEPCLPQADPVQLDAGSIFYHKNGCTPSQLICLGLPNGIALDTLLEAIDNKICQATNTYDYATYPIVCLRSRYVIIDHQSFVIAVDTEFCRLSTIIDNNYRVLSGRIDVLDATVQSIIHPGITNNCSIAFNDQSDIFKVLQGLSDKICSLTSGGGLPLETPNSSVDTASLAWSLSGVANRTLQAAVRLSATAGNQIDLKPDGLHVPPPSVVNQLQALSWDPLTRKLSLSQDGFVIIEAAPPQVLGFNCNTKILSLSGGSTPIDLSCLVPPIFAETPISVVPSGTVIINTSGIANHTLYADVLIDPTPGNALVKGAGGLYVSLVSNTPITKIDTQSIAISLSGADDHTVSANLIIDPTAGNAIQVSAQGVFVPIGTETPNTKTDSNTATILLSGTMSRNICVNVRIDPSAANLLSQSTAGLFVGVPPPTLDSRFGIEDVVGTQNRFVDMEAFAIQVLNASKFSYGTKLPGATVADDTYLILHADRDTGFIEIAGVKGYEPVDQSIAIQVFYDKIYVKVKDPLNAGTYPAGDHFLPISVNSTFADDTGNIELDLSGTVVPTTGAQVATTAPLPSNIYSNGTAGVGATLTGSSSGALPTIDGVAPVVGYKILVKDEADPKHNGLYDITQVGSGGTPYILTRSISMDSTSELYPSVISISAGTVNGGLIYEQDTEDPIVGLNNIVYSLFNVDYLKQTWQQTLVHGSALSQNNTILGSSFDFIFSSTGLYSITTSNIRLNAFANTTGKVLSTNSTGNIVLVDPTAITLAPIGSVPNANGATMASGTLNLQPASASFGGVVTTVAQSFNGVKSFVAAATAVSQIAKGTIFTPVLSASSNLGDRLTAIHIDPSFDHGIFTGVADFAIRHNGSIGPLTNNTWALGGTTFYYAHAYSQFVHTDVIQFLTTNLTVKDVSAADIGRWFTSTGNLHVSKQPFETTYKLAATGDSAQGGFLCTSWLTDAHPAVGYFNVNFNTLAASGVTGATVRADMYIPSGGIGNNNEFVNFYAVTQTYDRGVAAINRMIGFKCDLNWRAGIDTTGGVTDGIYGFYAKIGTIWANAPCNDVPKGYNFYGTGMPVGSACGRFLEAGHIYLEAINAAALRSGSPYAIKQLGVDNLISFEGLMGIGTAPTAAGFLRIGASTVTKAQLNLATGLAPTAPNDGDIWRENNTNTGLKIRVAGVTKTISLV